MKIVNTFPPNIEKIREKFQIFPNTVFTYGDTLHNPMGGYIDAYLMTHEETHVKQQGDNVEEWWNKYLEDNQFRFKQEVEAYHNQYAHFCRNKKDLVKQNKFLSLIASDLSGPMYGNICILDDAKEFIKIGLI